MWRIPATITIIILCSGGLGLGIVWKKRTLLWFRFQEWLKEREEEKEKQQELKEYEIAFHQRKPPDLWNTSIFFPCPYLNLETRELGPQAEQLVSYFTNTVQSLHICVHLVSFRPIVEAIVKKRREENLMVEVITDYDRSHDRDQNQGIKRFQRCGIRVKMKNTGHLMHNKFVIFDNEGKDHLSKVLAIDPPTLRMFNHPITKSNFLKISAVMTGSLNWTTTAVTKGFENVVITTNREIVDKYIREFAKLWQAYDTNI